MTTYVTSHLSVTFQEPDRPTGQPAEKTVTCQIFNHRLALLLKTATSTSGGKTDDSDLGQEGDARLEQLIPALKPVDLSPDSVGAMDTYLVPEFVSEAVWSLFTTGKLPPNSKVSKVWVADREA
jgi:hypothetical protein